MSTGQRELSTPQGDDQMRPAKVATKKKADVGISRYGILAPFVRLYYRYTVMTGIYMLGPVETGLLHFAYILGIYFLYTYVWTFIRDLEFWFDLVALVKK